MSERQAQLLFVCVENSNRSQMAEAFARKLGANQVSAFIPNVPNSPKLNVGLNPEVTASVDLAYSFSYAGTFEQTLWRESDTAARLHVYKSTQKMQGLELTAGVTLVSDGDNIEPAGSQARSIDLAPGKYLFVCNIPGHFKQGMFTVVTVAP